jgi:hypothetical protein
MMHLWESGYGVPVEMIRLVSAWVLVNGLLMKSVWLSGASLSAKEGR